MQILFDIKLHQCIVFLGLPYETVPILVDGEPMNHEVVVLFRINFNILQENVTILISFCSTLKSMITKVLIDFLLGVQFLNKMDVDLCRQLR